MEKIHAAFRNAFPVSAVWFGALVGPSMVSGTYAAVYFAPYGVWGIVLSYLSMTGICLIVGLAANIVRKNQTYEYAHFARVIYGKLSPYLLPVLDLFMILAMVVGGSAVISMAGVFFYDLFGISAVWGAVIMAVMGILLDMWGARLVRMSSAAMTLILILGFLALTVSGITIKSGNLAVSLSDWSIPGSSLSTGIKGAILLGFSNLGMATSLCSVEQNIRTKSDCTGIALCSLVLNGSAFALGTLFLLPYCPEVLEAEVTSTYIIENYIAKSYPWIRSAYLLVMFFALLSSSAPQLHAVSSRVLKFFPSAYGQKKEKLYNLIIGIIYMALCIAISSFGLYAIVSKGYSMLAKLGIPLIAFPIVLYTFRAHPKSSE